MEKQANSRHCFVCGIENPVGLHLKFYESGPGEVTAEFTPHEKYQGYPGVLHGGIVASILDETAGRAHMGAFPYRFLFTAKLEVRYRKNVPIGQPLKAIGKAGRSRARAVESWAGIFDAQNTLLAEATSLLIDVPQDVLDRTNLKEIGWKVYPD